MSRRAGPLRTPPDTDAVAVHYSRVDRSVRFYYSPANPDYVARFRFLAPDEVTAEREATIDEQAAESALSLLASLEAAFRVDYIQRYRRRPRDPLSRAMRDLFKEKGRRARLSDDILRTWRDHTAIPPSLIGEIRAAFRYRHWLAHGRYYPPKFGRAYSQRLARDGVHMIDRFNQRPREEATRPGSRHDVVPDAVSIRAPARRHPETEVPVGIGVAFDHGAPRGERAERRGLLRGGGHRQERVLALAASAVGRGRGAHRRWWRGGVRRAVRGAAGVLIPAGTWTVEERWG